MKKMVLSGTVIEVDDKNFVLETVQKDKDEIFAVVVNSEKDMTLMQEILKNERNVEFYKALNILTGIDLSDKIGLFYNLGLSEPYLNQLQSRFIRFKAVS